MVTPSIWRNWRRIGPFILNIFSVALARAGLCPLRFRDGGNRSSPGSVRNVTVARAVLFALAGA